jgi:lysophospholipase L1-like esterase
MLMDPYARSTLLAIVFACLCSQMSASARADGFLLRDGDTVAFLGDSITAARGYPKIVELYTLMRYPDRRIRFYNAGKGGDTAQTSISRLERDVFAHNATVMLVSLGVNDIGWGMKADAEHKKLYLDGIRTLIAKCKAKNVRVIVCSPAITAENPDTAEKGFLQKMADEGMELGKSEGAGAIDISRGMREIQRAILKFNAGEQDKTKHVTMHAPDTVHLNDLGQLAMAYAILKGLGAPDLVSSMTVDAKSGKVAATDGCQVTKVNVRDDGIAFTRTDNGLPMNRGILSGLDYRWVDVPNRLNRYELRVINLPNGKYNVRASGRLLGTLSAKDLSHGVNIASMTADAWEPGGPWDAQSDVVKELVDARDRLLFGQLFQQIYDPKHPNADELRQSFNKLDDDLITLERKAAQPQPYRFEISKANPNAETKHP